MPWSSAPSLAPGPNDPFETHHRLALHTDSYLRQLGAGSAEPRGNSVVVNSVLAAPSDGCLVAFREFPDVRSARAFGGEGERGIRYLTLPPGMRTSQTSR